MVMANLGGVLLRMVRRVVCWEDIGRHVRSRLGQLFLVVIHVVGSVLQFWKLGWFSRSSEYGGIYMSEASKG